MLLLKKCHQKVWWLGGLLIILAFVPLAVYLHAQPEAAGVPIDTGSVAVPAPGTVNREDSTTLTGSLHTVSGNEHIVPIRVAPFRDPERRKTERITVRGTVFEEGMVFPKKKCIGGAHVYLKEDSVDKACAAGETKADGTYLLEMDWLAEKAPTVLRVWAEKEGWVAWQRSVIALPTHVASYPERTYDLFLCSPIMLAGTIVDATTGAPIAGARIVQQGQDPRISFARSTTDAAGKFEARVADEPEGYLNVDAADHLGVRVCWEKATTAESLVIRLPQPHQIPQLNGRVVGADGAPCSGAPVGWRFEPPRVPPAEGELLMRQHLDYLRSRFAKHECLTDRNGKFSAALPGIGKWTVMTRVGEMTASRVIEVLEASTYTCELSLQ